MRRKTARLFLVSLMSSLVGFARVQALRGSHPLLSHLGRCHRTGLTRLVILAPRMPVPVVARMAVLRFSTTQAPGDPGDPPGARQLAVETLTEEDAAADLEALASELAYHDYLYYATSPTLTDAEYDDLARREADIESRFPGLARPDGRGRRVGTTFPAAGLAPADPHIEPMLSLDNSFNPSDLERFAARIIREAGVDGSRFEHVSVVGEPKVDGLSLSLRYVGRELIQAATRGDGKRGDDVTSTVRRVPDIPNTLPPSWYVAWAAACWTWLAWAVGMPRSMRAQLGVHQYLSHRGNVCAGRDKI